MAWDPFRSGTSGRRRRPHGINTASGVSSAGCVPAGDQGHPGGSQGDLNDEFDPVDPTGAADAQSGGEQRAHDGGGDADQDGEPDGMSWRPGRTSRPRAPMMRPTMIALMPVTVTLFSWWLKGQNAARCSRWWCHFHLLSDPMPRPNDDRPERARFIQPVPRVVREQQLGSASPLLSAAPRSRVGGGLRENHQSLKTS